MSSSSSAASWYPPPQRVQVKVGKVLNKVIKARKLKGEPAPPTNKRTNLPEFHYHSFLFKHKPISIDQTRPATLEVKKSADNVSMARAEFPSINPEDAYSMTGEETPAKEVDCLLIYDEVTNTWTLEKLDSFIRFQRVNKVAASSPNPASPASTAGTPSLKKGKAPEDKDDDLERQLLDLAGSSVQEDRNRKPPPPPPPAPSLVPNKRRPDSDDEEGEIEVPLRLLHQPAKESRNTKPIPKASPKAKASAASPQPPLPKSVPPAPATQPASSTPNPPKPLKTNGKASLPSSSASLPPKPAPSLPVTTEAHPLPLKSKKARPTPNAPLRPPSEEDILALSQPLKSAKRQRVAAPPPQPAPPPPPKPLDLSLPGGSGTFAPPPLPPSLPKPAVSKAALPPPPPPPTLDPKDPTPMIFYSDDEEDEWEAVTEVPPDPAPEPSRPTHSFNIVMEEENDPVIPDAKGSNMEDDDLEAALKMELFDMDEAADGNEMDYASETEEQDFLALALEEQPVPLSLSQYASQNNGGDDSDEMSSSSEEESDDD
ncbi:hypothetical protein CVT24_012604 [Panaeolus cyanescens]|uniref:Transcription elongation factor Eaf N-terminal domain-containing protein n=1 Tax=Panaeolus cyanescens TaxID=181874 RepID=A0A409YK02_9AGAR|nr:hypothetical protein CVT24_012604 [Panaeolus cyanescens]